MGITLLTGANGFLATHILHQLLEAQRHVLAVVRSEQAEEQLEELFQKNSLLRICIVPDYTAPDAFRPVFVALPGIVSVIHTPSFYQDSAVSYATAEKHPAIKATTGLLKTIASVGKNVRNVVITSSSAAVIDYARPVPGKKYTEEDWNAITWKEAQKGGLSSRYKASKKYMECAAYDFMEQYRPSFGLVALCPAAIFGPPVDEFESPHELNLSNHFFWKTFCAAGKKGPLAKQIAFTLVDVRDLAKAHILAMHATAAPKTKRIIISAHQFTNQQVCNILRSKVPALAEQVPLGNPDDTSLPEHAYDMGQNRANLLLGLQFRGLEDTIVDTATAMLGIE
ncbi:hypothetical protein BP5796_00801 [Coleophoma crateriformis]|uniref:NAD-dependent epimerase/dehydratase domain-containing protein n=1 Tax=Coleophoma crateriformis TaxID=565419 RepID=A0A3D8TB02_9HELO|nr:hypothetical protein BP5796_00801 [Coleophoma crateriformis]